MTEEHDERDSGSPRGKGHEPHLAGNAGQPASPSPNSEQPSEGQIKEWPGDCDDWEDELDEDPDRFEAPDGWDDDEHNRSTQHNNDDDTGYFDAL